ncbi:MAG TPA: hypothetical protein VIN61_00130 [Gammaproteobacteria bacterium]
MTIDRERFNAALRAARIPEGFSVVPAAQLIPRTVIHEIERFIEVFERVTTRPSWQRALTADAPPWARGSHGEACFFSAWDFHLSEDGSGWQLIEVNDNGSGFLFASIINATYAELSSLASDPRIDASPDRTRFDERLLEMVEEEARRFPTFVIDE